MNLEPSGYTSPEGSPPCQVRGCGHEWFEHRYNPETGNIGPCKECPCSWYREEPLERDEYEPYDY